MSRANELYRVSKLERLVKFSDVEVGMELFKTDLDFRLPTRTYVSFIHHANNNKDNIIIGIEIGDITTIVHQGTKDNIFNYSRTRELLFKSMEDFNYNAKIQSKIKSVKLLNSMKKHSIKLKNEIELLMNKITKLKNENKEYNSQEEMLNTLQEKYTNLIENINE